MNIKGRVRMTVSVAAVTVFSAVYILMRQDLREFPIYSRFEPSDAGESSVDYLLHNPRCKLRDLKAWDQSVRNYFKSPISVKCRDKPLLTYVTRLENGSYMLRIANNVRKKYQKRIWGLLICCYSEIYRISQSPGNYTTEADANFRYSKCRPFQDGDLLPNTTEFIKVKCVVRKTPQTLVEIYTDAHALVPILPSAAEKMEEFHRRSENESQNGDRRKRKRLNVLILGVDSVSRLHAKRVLPKTVRLLTQNKWIELTGYTKVADNTLPNLMAILSGHTMVEVKAICSMHANKSLDDCPYMWKNFSTAGYVTAYGEDTPDISTFNYLRTGFVEKPTDYYLRPFMLATQSALVKKKVAGLPVCVGPVAPVEHVLSYARRFLETFKDVNHFSLFWMNSFTHNDPNVASNMDRPLINFLNDLSNIGTYNNTVIILLSDHGSRFGPFRRSFRGYYEERLPFIFIWFPEWFRRNYPDLYGNLRDNQRKLTCPFDLHLTLDKILRMDYNGEERGLPSCPNCSSLFHKIPWNRDCRDAAISEVWCMCHDFKETNGSLITRLGVFVKDAINDRVRKIIQAENLKRNLCATWSISKVVRAHEVVQKTSEESNNRNSSMPRSRDQRFLLLVEMNPGKTHFEAMVKVKWSKHGKVENITEEYPPSSVDGYSKFSTCTDHLQLKYFCFCKKPKVKPRDVNNASSAFLRKAKSDRRHPPGGSLPRLFR